MDLQNALEAKLRSRLPPDAIDLSAASLPLPHPDASVSGAYAFGVLERWSDAGALLGEVFRVLRPGAPLVIHSRVADQGGSRELRTRVQVRVLLEHAGFQVFAVEPQNVWFQPWADGVAAKVTRADGSRSWAGRVVAAAGRVVGRAGAPIDRVGAAFGWGASCVVEARRP